MSFLQSVQKFNIYMKTIAFIPVRKESKGIPGKNLKKLGDKPLICWIVDTLLESNIADSVWVATDCDEMENLISGRYHQQVNIFRRSKESATDTAPSIYVVLEFLSSHSFHAKDWFILLQATSPFTSVKELRELKSEMRKEKYDAYVACCRLKKFHWSEDGIPLDYSFTSKPRRQDYDGLLIESGAYYASGIGNILQHRQLLSGRIKVMEVSLAGMIDIDEPEDWKLAEYYIEHQLYG